MSAIKALFGVVLLGVAIYLLERVVPEWVSLLLWAALFIISAIYMGALDSIEPGVSGWRRLWKGTGILLMVYGLMLMVGAGTGRGDLLRPLAGLNAPAGGDAGTHGLAFKSVKGPDALQAALRDAAAAGRPVMLDYYADWCVSCKEMERYTFTDSRVQSAVANAVLLQTDVTDFDALDKALLDKFNLYGPPAILFFSPDGTEHREFRVVGFMDADTFAAHVTDALTKAGG